MESEWIEKTLADISSDVSYGYTESATTQPIGPKFLRITDIQGGVVDWNNVPHCPIRQDDHQKYSLRAGDIVVARTGNSTGENYLFLGNADAVYASYLIRFRLELSQVDPRFIWYNLRTPRWWSFIDSSKTGSAQAGANAKILGRFTLKLPPLCEQRAIACILGALDDKIELNRRRNETLEGMARALFQSWFVEFDPVRAKAAGRAPSGLHPELTKLFPDSFNDSALGEIPGGWRVLGILEVAELLSGGTPKTSEPAFWGGNIPWASAKDVSQCGEPFLIETERRITHEGLENSATRIIPALSSVIVARGATTGRMTMFGDDIAMNQTCYALRSRSNTPFYLYLLLRHEIDSIVHTAHGSVFDTITTATFQSASVCVANLKLTDAFENLVSPFFHEILCLLKQSVTLACLRDTLLPKLISGVLRIRDAERIVGRAV
jgi:type I restriction enzyme S subunit